MPKGTDAEVALLEGLYAQLTLRARVGSDPVGFLYAWPSLEDREIVGLLASSLAYGRVAQIARSVTALLARLPEPSRMTMELSPRALVRNLAGFRHRFTEGADLARVLLGARRLREAHGSLEEALLAHARPEDRTIAGSLSGFTRELHDRGGLTAPHVLPDPERGSACKRLCLFLRWMVREDAVDPGGWRRVGAERLVVPLDVHMQRIARGLGMLTRRSPDWRAALEATEGFRRLAPHDPVRYDFALTRLGIESELDPSETLAPLWRGDARSPSSVGPRASRRPAAAVS